MKVNLCFEYNRKSEINQDTLLRQKTFEKSIIIQPGNNDVFVEINFNDSLIGFTNINSEEDFIFIFIEINNQRIFNPKINNYCHFLLQLKDIVNNRNSTLKIQNIFIVSFDSVFYKKQTETKIKNNDNNNNMKEKEIKNENNIDSESDSDSDEAEESKIINSNKNNLNESENNLDKIKEMRRISNLFRRIKIINDLMLFKNCSLEEFLLGKKNKETSESKNENDDKNKIEKDLELIRKKFNNIQFQIYE
jgi:hypothetical protein